MGVLDCHHLSFYISLINAHSNHISPDSKRDDAFYKNVCVAQQQTTKKFLLSMKIKILNFSVVSFMILVQVPNI